MWEGKTKKYFLNKLINIKISEKISVCVIFKVGIISIQKKPVMMRK